MNITDKKNIKKEYLNANIYEIERQIKLLSNQKEYYQKRLESLEKCNVFTKQEVKDIIEYLINKIEGEKYTIEKMHINTKSSSYHVKNMITEYTFLYLVKEDNKEKAMQDIKEKYNVKTINEENYIDNCSVMNVSDISDSYVKLSFYNRYSDHAVKFGKEKEERTIVIDIIDERFDYINKFIEELINKRLDRKNCKISLSETKMYIDKFAEEYSEQKKLVKENQE